MARATARRCSSCGGTPDALAVRVLVPGAPDVPGRVLLSCPGCRADLPAAAFTALVPLAVLDDHTDVLMTSLYRHRVTATDPPGAADTLGTTSRGWVPAAQRIIDATAR